MREQRYQETLYSEIAPNVPFRDDSSTQDIIQQTCSLEMERLMDTADLLAPQTVDRIVDLMKRSGRIALFGMSPNNLLGELFRRRMLTVGRMIEIPVLGDSGLLASTLRDTDCAIMISYSGNAPDREPLTAFRFLEPTRVPVVGITSYGPKSLFSISAAHSLNAIFLAVPRCSALEPV